MVSYMYVGMVEYQRCFPASLSVKYAIRQFFQP